VRGRGADLSGLPGAAGSAVVTALARVDTSDLRDSPAAVAARLGVSLTTVYAERKRRGIVGHGARVRAYWRARGPALRLAAAVGVLAAATLLGGGNVAQIEAARILGVSRERARKLREKVDAVVRDWRRA